MELKAKRTKELVMEDTAVQLQVGQRILLVSKEEVPLSQVLRTPLVVVELLQMVVAAVVHLIRMIEVDMMEPLLAAAAAVPASM